jgi:hypothetical protein
MAGKYLLALLLVFAAFCSSAPAVAQQGAPCDCQCGCCDDCSDVAPLMKFTDWMCHQPMCSLRESWSAATREVPYANWTAAPLSVGVFAGGMGGGALISDWVGTTGGFDGGFRFGWDVTPTWGTEMRFAFASLGLYDSYAAKLAYLQQGPFSGPPNNHRNAELFQWDVDVLYYPWRETRLRPYLLAGLGLTDVNFNDRLGQSYQTNCLSIPIGVGVKYLCDSNLAFRLDLIDDIAMSNAHLDTQNNVSLTAGMELRFGGSRKMYWPFDLGP